MMMNLFVFKHNDYLLRYNCSFYSVDVISLEERRHKVLGILLSSIGLVAELMYVPVIYAFCKKSLRQKSCFRLMLMMAFYDILCIPITTFIPGYFLFTGKMFCDAPNFLYVAGIFGFTCWSGYTLASLLLSINRCLAFTSFSWLFANKLQYFFMALPICWSAVICAFGKAPIWNSLVGAYMFNPHFGYFNDFHDLYYSYEQMINNFTLSIFLPLIYGLFYVHHTIITKGRSRIPKREYSLFMQVLFINSILSCASICYIMMQYIHLPRQLIFGSHLAWVFVQAVPPIIYLCFNETIRTAICAGKVQYNCSFYNLESLSIERRSHPIFASLIIIIGFVAELLYIPCTYALYKQAIGKKNFCYRLMLMMALADVFCLPISALESGYLTFNGKMFCSYNVLIYTTGIIGFCRFQKREIICCLKSALWSLYTSTSLILAINRCLAYSHYSYLFEGKKQYLWIIAPFVYSLSILLFARSPIWNSVYQAWFFNPHLSYFNDSTGVYTSTAQIGNNIALSILLPSTYFLFYLSHVVFSRGRSKMPAKEYSLFLQILIINSLLSCASFSYVLMNFITLPEQVVCVTHLAWVLIQSVPPVLLLTMNVTVQRTVFPRRCRVETLASTNNENTKRPVEIQR
ncbi:Serpentine receptor class gamma [Aphelenchoides besseyi]|nr:Serpentine receptor class gamma [Aphelenchoides besseyi]